MDGSMMDLGDWYEIGCVCREVKSTGPRSSVNGNGSGKGENSRMRMGRDRNGYRVDYLFLMMKL